MIGFSVDHGGFTFFERMRGAVEQRRLSRRAALGLWALLSLLGWALVLGALWLLT